MVTSAKFPGFKHEPAAVNQADEASESPLDAGGGAAYNPYAPSPDVPQPLGELKLNGKKAWEYVRLKIEDIDVQRLRPSRRATVIGTSVGGFVLLVVALLVLANNGGPAVEGTWMNDQGQRFTFRSDATASREDDSAAQWIRTETNWSCWPTTKGPRSPTPCKSRSPTMEGPSGCSNSSKTTTDGIYGSAGLQSFVFNAHKIGRGIHP